MVVWDPFEEMRKAHRKMDRLFSEISEMYGEKPSFGEFRQPTVDMINKPKEIVVIVELPGIKKDGISLNCESDFLEITAKSKKEKEKKKQGYYHQERSATSFKRSLTLPEEVNPKKAKAKFKNGILEVSLPKKKGKKGKKKRTIKVK